MNEKIKISKISRKQQPSKFKPGDTYTIATVLDEVTGRKASAFGKWTDGWSVGGEYDVLWKSNSYIDKDGFEQKGWNLENPEKKPFVPRAGGFAAAPSIVDAYKVAALLAPVLYASKKAIKFEDIIKIADAVKIKFDEALPAPVAPVATENDVKTVDVDTEEVTKPAATKVVEEDDENEEDPF